MPALCLAAGAAIAKDPAPATMPASRPAPFAYKKSHGPYDVVVVKELLIPDARRGASLQVCVRGPRLGVVTSSPLPLVVFSHGAGGSSDAFPELCEHWASHGYVVVNPTHSDSVKRRRQQGERFDGGGDVAQQVVGGVNLLDRRADVKLILDSLDRIEEALAEAGGRDAGVLRIDRERIAMAGHSAGAMTTQALAGVKFYGRRAGASGFGFAEPRLKAFIVLSGQGLGRPIFRKESWSEIHKPMLVIAGSEDRSPVSDESPEGRRHPYEYAPPGDKYLVFIEGATHGSYAGKEITRVLGEKPPNNIGYITDVTAFSTLAFLDAYLKDDAAARAYLSGDAIARYPGGRTDCRHK